jgi:hypothetical protein
VCTFQSERTPFDPDEEAALLLLVRKKRVWDCFAATPHQLGLKGFRASGYHEKLTLSKKSVSSISTSPSTPPRPSPAPPPESPSAWHIPERFLQTAYFSTTAMFHLSHRRTQEAAENLLMRHCVALFQSSFEQMIVFVVDATVANYKDNVIAENSVSTERLGERTKGRNRFLYSRFDQDGMAVHVAEMQAFRAPGQDQPVRCYLRGADGSEFMCQMTLHVDPETFFLVYTACLCEV